MSRPPMFVASCRASIDRNADMIDSYRHEERTRAPTPWVVSNEPDDSAGFGFGARQIMIRDANGRAIARCASDADAIRIVSAVNAVSQT